MRTTSEASKSVIEYESRDGGIVQVYRDFSLMRQSIPSEDRASKSGAGFELLRVIGPLTSVVR
jgi:hypothetical protein